MSRGTKRKKFCKKVQKVYTSKLIVSQKNLLNK